jgi:hypothetical protein
MVLTEPFRRRVPLGNGKPIGRGVGRAQGPDGTVIRPTSAGKHALG